MFAVVNCARCGRPTATRKGSGLHWAIREGAGHVCRLCDRARTVRALEGAIPGQRIWIGMYLAGETVTNWPGTLRIPVTIIRRGHNWRGVAVDHIWFKFHGAAFYARRTVKRGTFEPNLIQYVVRLQGGNPS